jgi:hypothetical protein
MDLRRIATFLAGVSLLFFTQAGAAQQTLQCGDRDTVLAAMLANHNESPAFRALLENGHAIEVLTTPDGSTWTMHIVTPDGGTACLVGTGKAWTVVPKGERS